MFVLMNLLNNTGPGVMIHDGKELPEEERRENPKKRSCGVTFVAVDRRDLSECSTSVSTNSQC